jgi:hypothetical protein
MKMALKILSLAWNNVLKLCMREVDTQNALEVSRWGLKQSRFCF